MRGGNVVFDDGEIAASPGYMRNNQSGNLDKVKIIQGNCKSYQLKIAV